MRTIWDIAKNTKKYKEPSEAELKQFKKTITSYKTELNSILHKFYESRNIDEEIYSILSLFDKSLIIKERLKQPSEQTYHSTFFLKEETIKKLNEKRFHHAINNMERIYNSVMDFFSRLEEKIDISLLDIKRETIIVEGLEFLVLHDQKPENTECRKFSDYGNWDVIDSKIKKLSEQKIILNYSNPEFLKYDETIRDYAQGMIIENEIKCRVLRVLGLNTEKDSLKELGISRTYRGDLYENTFFAGFQTKKEDMDVILSIHKHGRGVALDVYLIMELDEFNKIARTN